MLRYTYFYKFSIVIFLMKINVGSANPVKVEAVRECIQDYDFLKHAEVISVKVDSEVSNQPKSLEEVIRGAMNRARNSFKNCDYSVGYESGIIPVPYTKTGFLNIGACVFYNGKKFNLGMSAPFEYPLKVMEPVLEQGMEINEAFFKSGLTEKPKVGSEEGAISILTKGRISRKDYTKQAIAMALIQLENPELYEL